MKKFKNIKKISIISIAIILLLVLAIKVVIAYSPNDTTLIMKWSQFLESKNVLCNNEDAHMLAIELEPGQTRVGQPVWTYKRESITNYRNDWNAYFLAYTYENRIAIGHYDEENDKTTGYPDYYQSAWWSKKSERTDAFVEYRKNGTPTLKIKDLKRKDYQTITFTLEGPHNDEYGFGEIKNVKVYDGATNKSLKTIENAKY